MHVLLCNERNITFCFKFPHLHPHQILLKLVNIWLSYSEDKKGYELFLKHSVYMHVYVTNTVYKLHIEQESWAIAKMTARCAVCMGALKIFGSPWLRPRLLFLKFSMGFCSDWAYINTHAKFEFRSFTRSWDNRVYPEKLGSPWIRPRSLFSKIFNGLLFRWTLWMYWPNLKSRPTIWYFNTALHNSGVDMGSEYIMKMCYIPCMGQRVCND